MEIKNKGGRPRKEEHRKITMRYARVEDTFAKIIPKIQNQNDKKLVLEALETLKK